MSRLSLGIIEVIGLAAGVEAADAAVKSANVNLIGYELTKGGGMVTIKLEGDVGAVKAAVDAGCMAAEKVNRVVSKKVIARPHEELEQLIRSKDTVGIAVQGKEEEDEDKEGLEGNTEPEKEESQGQEAEEIAEVEEKVEEAIETVEPKVEEGTEEAKVEAPQEEGKGDEEVCNLCGDPKCPRRKRDLRTLCMHYEELEN